MLDFGRLVKQIELVGRATVDEQLSFAQIVEGAKQAYRRASERPAEFEERLDANMSSVLWPLALPVEPLAEPFKLVNVAENNTVMAVDGSQIMPSQHEIHNCFLLNIGFVQLAYGRQEPPVLQSFPHLFHKREDLYPLVDRRRLHIDELYVSLERSLLEFEYLVNGAAKAQQIGQPVLAMVDGSLIPWSVERMPESYQRRYLEKCTTMLGFLKEKGIPVIGYISHSRSCDIVNDLRVWLCPYEQSRCKEHCAGLNEEVFPCSMIWPLQDRTLLLGLLPDYHRTPTFLSGASVAKLFPKDMQICFLYLNIKDEIARIEFPRWLLSDQDRFDTALGAVLAQAIKGKGYPVALAEAHHLAVIKGADRQQFFDLLTRHLVALGARQVSVSPKEKRKRQGLV